MNNNKLIAEALLEIAKRSETTFLEVGKEDKELIEAAKKIGIELPSPDLMVMKTVYAEIDKVNLNGVILPRKDVEKGLKTLQGKQCNWEHSGSGYICGYTISAKINEDKVETINVLFKSLFPEQADELKEKVKSGKAAVSFEIWNKNPDTGESVVKELANGFKEISPIIFHGTGVLLANKPACPKAKIFKLISNKLIEEAEKIAERIFSEDLIYASLAIEEPICKKCEICNCEKEVDKVELEKLYVNVLKEEDVTFDIAMTFYYSSDEEKAKLTEDAAKWTRKFINSLPDSAFAVIEPAYPEKSEDKNCRHLPHHNGEGDLGKEKSNANLDLPHYKNALARASQIKSVTDSISTEDLQKKAISQLERHKDALEKSSEETKTEEKATETKTEPIVAETKVEEPKVEETKEVKAQELQIIEPKIIVKVTRIYSDTFVDTYADGTMSGTSEGKSFYKTITEYKDGTQDVVEGESEYKKKYDFAELEAKVAEAIKVANDAKDVEINSLKAEIETKKVEVSTAKAETETVKTELGQKNQEIETLKAKKEEVEPLLDLNVGIVTEKNEKDKIKARQDEINERGFGKKK